MRWCGVHLLTFLLSLLLQNGMLYGHGAFTSVLGLVLGPKRKSALSHFQYGCHGGHLENIDISCYHYSSRTECRIDMGPSLMCKAWSPVSHKRKSARTHFQHDCHCGHLEDFNIFCYRDISLTKGHIEMGPSHMYLAWSLVGLK